jgi:hypothetical protein
MHFCILLCLKQCSATDVYNICHMKIINNIRILNEIVEYCDYCFYYIKSHMVYDSGAMTYSHHYKRDHVSQPYKIECQQFCDRYKVLSGTKLCSLRRNVETVMWVVAKRRKYIYYSE